MTRCVLRCTTFSTPPTGSDAFSSPSSSSSLGSFMEFTFSQEPQDTVTVQGGTLQLDCQAQSDAVAEPPSIAWRKDGVLLSTMVDERRRQLANGSLLVQNVMHSRHHRPDEGEYQCLATLDGLGSIVSRVARVSVAGKGLPHKVILSAQHIDLPFTPSVGLTRSPRFHASYSLNITTVIVG